MLLLIEQMARHINHTVIAALGSKISSARLNAAVRRRLFGSQEIPLVMPAQPDLGMSLYKNN